MLSKTCNENAIIAGVAVGGGWQALVAYINLFCYYVIGLPLGFLLGYKTRLGVEVKYYFLLSLIPWLGVSHGIWNYSYW